jgi:hypothetical protein
LAGRDPASAFQPDNDFDGRVDVFGRGFFSMYRTASLDGCNELSHDGVGAALASPPQCSRRDIMTGTIAM